MEIQPLTLEQQLRVERLKRHVKELTREELELYTQELIELCQKLTHQSRQLVTLVAETQLGLEQLG